LEDKRALVLIPARYASSRFPGKPLALIAGKSMIQRVYENCQQAGQNSLKIQFSIAVVTDHDEISDHVKSFGGEVCRVDDPVSTGSERICLAYQRFYSDKNFDLVFNVQGDEPLLMADELISLASFHLDSTHDLTTLVKPMLGRGEDFKNSNRVKAVFSKENGRCHYFSRAPIPHNRDNTEDENGVWHLHIGVYSFRPAALDTFCAASESPLEAVEKLEQLRALDLGLSIGAMETNLELMGVDDPSDIQKLEEVLRDQENK
jgi:3-deoxy-manno-octulosonate cytidylyltransferase (CMP-KDO synthetase)